MNRSCPSAKPEASSSKACTLIRDIAYEYNADDGLSYSSPARGVWNIVHIGTLVPGGHQIYVCPTSCLRGVVLTTAELGAMDRLSTITVGEDNILEGDMEETLHEGVRKVIDSLPVRPRMMMVFTSCIHHFLAVNYQRIYRLLRKEYPDIDFIDCYMHPIMRRTSPPVPTLWRQMYRVLRPESPDTGSMTAGSPDVGTAPCGIKDPRQVSILACEFPRDAHCDAVQHLKQHGIHIADVTGSKTYDEFLTMSRSSLNLLFHKAGMKAAKDLEIRLKQPYLMMRPVYVYDEVDADLAALSERLGIPAPSAEETEKLRVTAEQAAADAAAVIKDTPVSVDGTAVDCPLGLCVYLLEHGFRVETLFVDNFTEPEEVFQKLRSLKPDLKVYSALNWNMRQKERGWRPEGSRSAAGPDGAASAGSPAGPGGANGPDGAADAGSPAGPGGAVDPGSPADPGSPKIVAIGQRAAYFHDTNYFVDLVNNDGMYGYRGIVRLMELLTEAFREEKDMRRLIQIKGWGCSCG